jgi:hypothetical protein
MINIPRFSCQVPIILVRFERNVNFVGKFSKNIGFTNDNLLFKCPKNIRQEAPERDYLTILD